MSLKRVQAADGEEVADAEALISDACDVVVYQRRIPLHPHPAAVSQTTLLMLFVLWR